MVGGAVVVVGESVVEVVGGLVVVVGASVVVVLAGASHRGEQTPVGQQLLMTQTSSGPHWLLLVHCCTDSQRTTPAHSPQVFSGVWNVKQKFGLAHAAGELQV